MADLIMLAPQLGSVFHSPSLLVLSPSHSWTRLRTFMSAGLGTDAGAI